MNFSDMQVNDLKLHLNDLEKRYEEYKSQNLKLNMSRGVPCAEQLDLSAGLMDCLSPADFLSEDKIDCRNYGVLDGIPEAKRLFAEMMEVRPEEIIIGGNSSLNMMFDAIARAMSHGVYGGDMPWGKQGRLKFICPCPGYDRHFSITEFFGIEMIVVDMLKDGPDMDAVEKLVSEDDSVKGIWCVPKYSNPEGITYSDSVVDRMANLKPKAKDFRIFWDDAYSVHHLSESPDKLKNILTACKEAGNEDMVFVFASTSKITFPGAGLAAIAASENNCSLIKQQLFYQTIGPDKLNQLRHVRLLKNIDGIKEHMKKHAAIIKPKFDAVLGILERELGDKGIASWNKPNGGYFISLNTPDHCAREVVQMVLDAGVILTPAGSTYPYKNDPKDKNIRIAPTLPPVAELKKAIDVLCICIQIVAARKLLSKNA